MINDCTECAVWMSTCDSVFFTLLVFLKSVFSNSATCSSSSLHVKRRESFGGIMINKMGVVKRKQKLFLKRDIHHTFTLSTLDGQRLNLFILGKVKKNQNLLLLIDCVWYKGCGRWNSYTKSSNVVLKKQLNTRRLWHRAYSSLSTASVT